MSAADSAVGGVVAMGVAAPQEAVSPGAAAKARTSPGAMFAAGAASAESSSRIRTDWSPQALGAVSAESNSHIGLIALRREQQPDSYPGSCT